jgi:hypothetical protein
MEKHVAKSFVATAKLNRDAADFDYDAVFGLNLQLTSVRTLVRHTRWMLSEMFLKVSEWQSSHASDR